MKLVFFIILNLLFNLSIAYSEEDFLKDPKAQQLLRESATDIIMGDKNAPVTMIEYSSLSCPHCAYFHKGIFNSIKEKYIDTGKVKYIHRDFPLDQVALKGSVLAHCATPDRYYIFLKVLFEKQESWAFQKNYTEILENIGKLGGISGEKFQSCLADKNIENGILDSRLNAVNILQINSTPTFFLNGEKVAGFSTIEAFSKILDKKLAQK